MEENHLSDDEETLLLHFKRKKFIKLSPFITTKYNPKKTPRIGVNSIHTQSSHTTTLTPNRKKRSQRNSNRYKSHIIHDQQHLEEQEVAMCLIMLSTHNTNKNNNMLDFDLSNSQDPDRNTTKVVILKDLMDKNTQFKCTTCNQMFHSYQALGGHRASHNKNNNLLLASPDTTQPKRRNKKIRDTKSDNPHECPICFKVFQSGQALGGHKRSHLLSFQAKNNPSQASLVVNPLPEITRSFLDLNLPAPIEYEEDEGDESSSTTDGTLKLHQPWWVGSNLKHETVIAN